MSMNAKQAEFTVTMARFLVWCFDSGYPVIGAEWYRPPETAALYAEQGRGIVNSNHTRKLAFDVFRVVDGRVTWDREAYRPLAEKWVSMHPLARAGYYMQRRDDVHFSFEHRGVA